MEPLIMKKNYQTIMEVQQTTLQFSIMEQLIVQSD